MDALISVVFVVQSKRGENTQFNARCVAIFLDRPDDFDSTFRLLSLVVGFDNFAKSSLAKESDDIICTKLAQAKIFVAEVLTSICQWSVRCDDIMTVVIVHFLVLVQSLKLVSQ